MLAFVFLEAFAMLLLAALIFLRKLHFLFSSSEVEDSGVGESFVIEVHSVISLMSLCCDFDSDARLHKD